MHEMGEFLHRVSFCQYRCASPARFPLLEAEPVRHCPCWMLGLDTLMAEFGPGEKAF